MRNRFLHPGPFTPGEQIELAGEEFHHAARVARCREGEEIELLDGHGAMALGVVASLGRNSAVVRVVSAIEEDREARVPLTLAMALIQPEKFEIVLQKATELGVSRIVPILSARGEVRIERVAGRRDRWEKIVLEAVKQSGRSRIPEIAATISFEHALASSHAAILLDADGTAGPVASGPSTLFIGPEGGWSPEELAAARTAGVAIRRLGPRRLRAETAAIAALSIVASEVGNL
jgi:16S rRNA (uracil1498-N3)-methyltransferase